ncbi:MAG: carbon storage regulator [Gemmatimonadetes bacterium]|nr:carbon storage regulator [Gemmatimonadota bacterium]
MLILSRKQGDAVLIDGGIRVEVVAVDGTNVRLGIEAPSSVGIVREEIAVRIADENRRAGSEGLDPKWLDAFRPAPPGDTDDTTAE